MSTRFSELGITTNSTSFVGIKMPIDRILNKEIVVHDFRIAPSNKVEGTTCLHLQISIDDIKYVTFTGSRVLQELINKIPKEKFPIITTILKNDRTLSFT